MLEGLIALMGSFRAHCCRTAVTSQASVILDRPSPIRTTLSTLRTDLLSILL